MAQFFLDRLALGDVAHHDAADGCAAISRRNGCLHPCREGRTVFSRHAQFERLRCACLEELLAMQVVVVGVFANDKAAQWLLGQSAPRDPQQGSAGEIRFEDQSVFVQSEIPYRRQIVEVKVASTRGFERVLRLAQFLVLQLEFNLVHLQIVEQALPIGGREGVQIFQHPARLIPGNFFRLLAQHLHRAGGRLVFSASLALQTPALSVVAMAYTAPDSLTNAVAVSDTRTIRPSLAIRSIS